MSEVITRFAPSPTGLMHLGNVRTALLNWLYARKNGGRFLLRFEDTDQDRSELHFVEAIKTDLNWLGLDWDGDILFQSGHAEKHAQALQSLAEQGCVYRCFCTENQLNLDRKLATSRGLPPRYAGRCRVLSADESADRAQEESFVWRLAVHGEEGEVIVADALRENVHFARRDLDDPVLVRSDGTFTFLMPNALDDALDGITHTLRGDDHLTNSAYQVWLLGQLGFTPPVYLHHGLLLGEDGAKLSKRTGSHSVAELREDGLLPDALLQAMARLGHPNIPEHVHHKQALAEHFNAQHVSTSSVRWTDSEMWRWHTRLLHELQPEQLADLLRPLVNTVDDGRLVEFAALIGGNIERIEDIVIFKRLLDMNAPVEAEAQKITEQAGYHFYHQAFEAWQAFDGVDWKVWLNTVKDKTGVKGKSLFMPLRVALSGALHGPEMSDIIAYLGRKGVAGRLEQTRQQLEQQ
jgi:glutamyl-tRNA synthetase